MVVKPSILLLLVLVICSVAEAAKLPLLEETLTGGAEQAELPQPKPTNLNTGWWHYFDVPEEQLLQRADLVQKDLQQVISTLPDGVAANVRSFIQLIQANLTALPEARAQPSPEPPAPPAYAESYTVSQLLQLSHKLRELKETLRSENFDYRATEKNVNALSSRNETQFAAYLNLEVSDPQRTRQGLEIMAERLSLLVARERMRLQKAGINALEVQIKQIQDEIAVAENRLTGNPEQLSRIASEMAKTQAELDAKHNILISEQASASSVIANNEKNKITKSYRRQRVVNATIEEAIVKIQMFALQAQRQTNLLLMNSNAQNVNPVRTQLIQWNGELTAIEEQIDEWTSYSERERQRAGRAMTSNGSESDDDANSISISLLQQLSFEAAQETLLTIERLQDQISQTRLVLHLLDKQVVRTQGLIKDFFARGEEFVKKLATYATQWISASLFTVGDTPVTALGLLRIALILTIAWWISHWLRRALAQLGQRGDGSNLPAFYTMGRLSHYLIVILGFLIGLSSIGMDFTNFALVAGALAIGIGFGLQEIVNNFISGLILLFERSLKVGDFVQLASGVHGEVKAINVRSTQIKTNENIDIVVPNSEFMNTNVINWTLQEPYMRVHYPFRIAFKMDKDLVRKAGLEAAENVTHTLSGIPGKNPQVWLVGFGENGYNFELVVWLTPSAVKRPQAVRAAYYWELETALRKYGIEVPIPQRDLYLRGGFQIDEKDDDSDNVSPFPQFSQQS